MHMLVRQLFYFKPKYYYSECLGNQLYLFKGSKLKKQTDNIEIVPLFVFYDKCFLFSAGSRGSEPKRNGIKGPPDRRMENGVN